MTKIFVAASAVWLTGHFLTGEVRAESARVEVATLDDAPVYHWRAFDSQISDDVNRALILREFARRQFKVPERFVEKEVQTTIQKDAGGDEAKFVEQLRLRGATLADYRQFVREEIMMNAMLYRNPPDEAAVNRWLSGLRANARVKRLHTASSASK